jgi:hypothetical protein
MTMGNGHAERIPLPHMDHADPGLISELTLKGGVWL